MEKPFMKIKHYWLLDAWVFFLVNSTLICRLKWCDVRMTDTDIYLVLKDRDYLAEDLSVVKHILKRLLDGHADGSITELTKVMQVLRNLQEHLEWHDCSMAWLEQKMTGASLLDQVIWKLWKSVQQTIFVSKHIMFGCVALQTGCFKP